MTGLISFRGTEFISGDSELSVELIKLQPIPNTQLWLLTRY